MHGFVCCNRRYRGFYRTWFSRQIKGGQGRLFQLTKGLILGRLTNTQLSQQQLLWSLQPSMHLLLSHRSSFLLGSLLHPFMSVWNRSALCSITLLLTTRNRLQVNKLAVLHWYNSPFWYRCATTQRVDLPNLNYRCSSINIAIHHP